MPFTREQMIEIAGLSIDFDVAYIADPVERERLRSSLMAVQVMCIDAIKGPPKLRIGRRVTRFLGYRVKRLWGLLRKSKGQGGRP